MTFLAELIITAVAWKQRAAWLHSFVPPWLDAGPLATSSHPSLELCRPLAPFLASERALLLSTIYNPLFPLQQPPHCITWISVTPIHKAIFETRDSLRRNNDSTHLFRKISHSFLVHNSTRDCQKYVLLSDLLSKHCKNCECRRKGRADDQAPRKWNFSSKPKNANIFGSSAAWSLQKLQ